MARPRSIGGLDCEGRFADAAVQVIAVRGEELLAHADGVLDVSEVEALHDMRVATRRLRAALEVFAPCFPRKPLKKVLKRVKELASALGERRDPDVAIELLEELGGEVEDGGRRALDLLMLELRTEQRLANERLAPHLEEESLADLARALSELVREVRA